MTIKQYIQHWLGIINPSSYDDSFRAIARSEVKSHLRLVFSEDNYSADSWEIARMKDNARALVETAVANRANKEAKVTAINAVTSLILEEKFLDSIVTRILSKQIK